MRPDVRPSPLLEPGMHMVGVSPGGMRSEVGDALASARAEGVLRESGEIPRECRGRCADCGCESGVEESELKFKILDWVQVVGMSETALVVGAVVRDGVECYALSGLAGIWPSWLVEAA